MQFTIFSASLKEGIIIDRDVSRKTLDSLFNFLNLGAFEKFLINPANSTINPIDEENPNIFGHQVRRT